MQRTLRRRSGRSSEIRGVRGWDHKLYPARTFPAITAAVSGKPWCKTPQRALTESDQSRTHCRRVLRSRCESSPLVSEGHSTRRISAHVVVGVGGCRGVERGVWWRRERVLVDHLLHQVGILQELFVDLLAVAGMRSQRWTPARDTSAPKNVGFDELTQLTSRRSAL